MLNIKELAATLAILGSGTLVVTGCNKDKPATETPGGDGAAATDGKAEGTCGEGKAEGEHKAEGTCGEGKAEGTCGEGKAEGACGGEGKAEAPKPE